MKKWLSVTIMVLLFTACAAPPQTPVADEQTILGKVLRTGETILIKDDRIGLFTIPKGNPELMPGDLVTIKYDGVVLESYPAQLGKVQSVEVRGKSPDVIGALVERYRLLKNQDSLGQDTDHLYVDLNQLTILDQHDKFALMEGLRTVDSRTVEENTLEGLKAAGKFDEKGLVIKDGTLLTLATPTKEDTSFQLDISIYRSGTGAIGEKLKAEIKEDKLDFKLLEQWFS